jgi:L-amino acid N-acyltransferase YncA
MAEPVIRPIAPGDVAAVAAIYAGAVLTSTATFEIEPPDEATMRQRVEAILAAGYPYLVALQAGAVVGYAYANLYRPRIGYRYSVEDSVYVAAGARGQGIGRALLEALIERCAAREFRQMIAVIGDGDNTASIALHVAAGFTRAGQLKDVGYKFGRWIDSILMQRPLGAGGTRPIA